MGEEFPGKPKGMHRRTYWRLFNDYESVANRSWAIDKLEARKAANLKLIEKYEGTKNLRGRIPESTLEKIAELRQANEGYDDTIRWLREAL
jgi:hypothetical protein